MPDDDYRKSLTESIRASAVLSIEKLIKAKLNHPKRMENFRDWLRVPKKVGAPKGRWWNTTDAPLRDAMEREAAETENFKPYQFARFLVKKTELPEIRHDAAIRRLVRWWENPDRQN